MSTQHPALSKCAKDLEGVAKYVAKNVAKSVAKLNVCPPASFFSNLPTASRKSPYNTFACALYLYYQLQGVVASRQGG
jgi:hypothetical protein